MGHGPNVGGTTSYPQETNPVVIVQNTGGGPVVLVAGQAGALSADENPPYGDGNVPTGSVDFFDGSTLLGTADLDGSGDATIDISSLPVGSDTITAVYSCLT